MDMQRVTVLTVRNGSSSAHTGPVVYVMSRDQRVSDNHALLAAQQYAIEQQAPLIVLFCAKVVKGRSYEQYQFMYEGLISVAQKLQAYSIPFIVRRGTTLSVIATIVQELSPRGIFFDFSPLGGAAQLYATVTKTYPTIPCFVVDTHNIIPVWVISNKREFAAHTLRRKVTRQLADWLNAPAQIVAHPFKSPTDVHTENLSMHKRWIATIPRSGVVFTQQPGEEAARGVLKQFLSHKMMQYADEKNDPTKDGLSGLSSYLHFGMLSSLRVALDVIASLEQPPLLLREARLADTTKDTPQDVFLEELIVRKELADNFCYYSEEYQSLTAAWPWAQQSLEKHAHDEREYIYTLQKFRNSETHDLLWNAAQNELRTTGKMHGYMRMYWAKKILEWSTSAEEALDIAIQLNDFYSLDGGDPNGYVGILWSIAGVHDRPWFDRPVYGAIRYMTASGLKKKFDTTAYVACHNAGYKDFTQSAH